MKNVKLKSAIVGLFSILAIQVSATGLVVLSATGASSSSAYLECFALGQTPTNPKNNYGSSGAQIPTTTTDNNCAVFPANEATPPETGFTLIVSTNRTVTVNNSYTNNTTVNVGTVTDRVWRDSANTSCIYGTKFVPANIDYRPTIAGNQYFEVNDIARAGFNGSGTVAVGYFTPNVNPKPSPVYRIGRTYTSVQHRAQATSGFGSEIPGKGYVSLPPSAGGSTASINGVDGSGSPTSTQQTAAVNANWIDFTTDVSYVDEDGYLNSLSGMTYIKAACTAAAPVTVNDAIRLRQTAQENARFIQVSVPGYVPPGGNALPVPAVPF